MPAASHPSKTATALWIQRNRLRREGKRAVAVLHSEDAHYSTPKACELLGLAGYPVEVEEQTRQMAAADVAPAPGLVLLSA